MDTADATPPRSTLHRWLVVGTVIAVVGAAWLLSRLSTVVRFLGDGTNSSDDAVAVHDPRYPRAEPVPGLLDEPVTLGRLEGISDGFVTCTTWTDHAPSLVLGGDGLYAPYGRGARALRTEGSLAALHVLPTAHGGTRAVALLREGRGAATHVVTVGLDAGGATTWRWKPQQQLSRALALRYGRDGPVGVVVGVGGKEGLVGLDLDGRPQWSLEKRFVVYGVATHPALPGRLLKVGGGFELLDATDPLVAPRVLLDDAAPVLRGDEPRMFVHAGTIVPDARGAAAVALAGKELAHDIPRLLLVREDGTVAWWARPPSVPQRIAVVEAPGRPRLFAVTTEGGDLLVVDEDGTLRAAVRLPETPIGRHALVYDLAAGPVGPQAWGIAVRLLHGTYLYAVHPERLPQR